VPSLQNANLSLECSTCHQPHGGVGEEHLLRQPVVELCGECHTSGESLLGKTPHHPQFDMLKGIGAFKEDGTPLVQVGPHTGLALSEQFPGGKGCAQCHIVEVHPEEVNQGNPVRTGHTFNPFDQSIPNFEASSQYQGCTLCHTVGWAEEHRVAVQLEITELLTEVGAYFDQNNPAYIQPDGLSENQRAKYDVAVFNYKFVKADSSLGIHNPANTKVALRTARKILESLAAPEPNPEP